MQGNKKKNIEWNNTEKSAFNYSPIVDYKNSRHIKIGLMNKLCNLPSMNTENEFNIHIRRSIFNGLRSARVQLVNYKNG